ncbi:MAG TPA: thiamine phosphate synthase [Candidatus Coprenecus pullistercoris]|nr:thiamine phosphate synthase [Candidatus Coprenecus pullistercoris]
MHKDFRVIVITAPDFLPDEAEAIAALLDAGAWRVHVRKPGADAAEVQALIEAVPERYYSRISLHDSHELVFTYGIGGVHLNSRNPEPPDGFTGLVSRSCHSFGELAEYAPVCDYMFLSPIFDSISKEGYVSRFLLEGIRRSSHDPGSGVDWRRVFALGGVCPDNIRRAADAGFGGAAVLGYIWEPYKRDADAGALVSRFKGLCF